jgi:predicted RNase H-related nuclease YkuK (DUF458 family)
MELQFKRLSDGQIVDLNSYVKDFMVKFPETKIFIGCDSQNQGKYTTYALVIVLHQPTLGGHVLYQKIKLDRIRDRFERLWNEVEYSLQVAEFMKLCELPKPDYIDLDFNPDPKFKSNQILRSALGYIEAMGYTPRCKPDALSASYVADAICK